MSAFLIVIGVILLLALIFVVYAVGIYNRLVTLRNRFKNAFSQIDVQLQRRYDLIPNLVESTKAYLKHESETLEAVIAARNQAQAATAMASLMGAESLLGGAMGKLMVTVEDYPELKADQTVKDLMEELTSTENKVAFSRQAFNDSVMIYNTAIEQVPSNIIAGMFSFTAAEPFENKDEAVQEAPKVSLT
ncbi:UNVERIFIED_CONTAM: hypothetical protein GTU68_025352 [Idotea baltica]|nr:hypothetical protein [Idotea baltica]